MATEARDDLDDSLGPNMNEVQLDGDLHITHRILSINIYIQSRTDAQNLFQKTWKKSAGLEPKSHAAWNQTYPQKTFRTKT